MEPKLTTAQIEAACWLTDVTELAAVTERRCTELRDQCRATQSIPPYWYALTELLIAMSSIAFALDDIVDRSLRASR
jgi:hypothetical protein